MSDTNSVSASIHTGFRTNELILPKPCINVFESPRTCQNISGVLLTAYSARLLQFDSHKSAGILFTYVYTYIYMHIYMDVSVGVYIY